MNGGSGVWKWVAAFFAGLVIAGLPTMIIALSAPTRGDLDRLQAQVNSEEVQLARLQEQLGALVETLRQHLEGG